MKAYKEHESKYYNSFTASSDDEDSEVELFTLAEKESDFSLAHGDEIEEKLLEEQRRTCNWKGNQARQCEWWSSILPYKVQVGREGGERTMWENQRACAIDWCSRKSRCPRKIPTLSYIISTASFIPASFDSTEFYQTNGIQDCEPHHQKQDKIKVNQKKYQPYHPTTHWRLSSIHIHLFRFIRILPITSLQRLHRHDELSADVIENRDDPEKYWHYHSPD